MHFDATWGITASWRLLQNEINMQWTDGWSQLVRWTIITKHRSTHLNFRGYSQQTDRGRSRTRLPLALVAKGGNWMADELNAVP